jgi:hypothetical protein
VSVCEYKKKHVLFFVSCTTHHPLCTIVRGCVGWLCGVAVWCGCVVWLCGAWLRGVAACGGCVVAACGGCVG